MSSTAGRKPAFVPCPTHSFEQKWDLAYKRYRGTMNTFARNFVNQIPGHDEDDLVSVLHEVLWKCIENYDPERGASFNTLFQGSAQRRLISMVRTANTKKRTAVLVSLDVEETAAAIDEAMSDESAEDSVLRRMDFCEVLVEYGPEVIEKALTTGRSIKRKPAAAG